MGEVVFSEDHRSKIVSLKIENFMSIKDALLEFDDSNIISLCGYNDSGKSAVTRLMEVMLYDAYPTEQVRFITDEEDYFRGTLTFDDGVVFTRTKFADGRSCWELSKDGQIIYTNKLQNGTYAAMDGNPEIVDKYLGVVRDEQTGEKLNVRRNSDKLFLIATSGGDNYKILNSVLKSEVLSQATKSLTEDKNKLNGEVNELKTRNEVISEQYEKIEVAPKDYIDDLKESISTLNNDKGRLQILSTILNYFKEKESIALYDETKPLEISRLMALENIMRLQREVSVPVYGVLDSSKVNEGRERLKALQNIMSLRGKIVGQSYDALSPIDVGRVRDIVEIGNLYNKLYGVSTKLHECTENLLSKRTELQKMSEQYGFKVCKNCGAIVE